jgi:hypothetical protein
VQLSGLGRRTLAGGLGLLLTGPASAQVRVGPEAQVTLTFRHVWRGITRTSKISLQPELSGSARYRGFGLAAGVWSSYELEKGGRDQRTALGVDERGLAERNYWVEARLAIGAGSVGLGFIRYNFFGDPALGGIGPARNTSEVYGSLDLSGVFLAPRVDLYVDVDRIEGSYLAGSLTAPFVAWPFPPPIAFVADLSWGLVVSQARDPDDPLDPADFADTGVSHTRLGVRGMWSPTAWLTVGGGYRVQYSFDEATRDRIGPQGPHGRLSGWGHLDFTLYPEGP